MDLELTDEQRWLRESIDTLLTREWVSAEAVAETDAGRRTKVWEQLVDFGALSVGPDALGLTELCLVARSLGEHLACVPFLGSAAVRLAIEPYAASLPAGFAALLSSDDTVGLALLEAGSGWALDDAATVLAGAGDGYALHGEKLAVEGLGSVDRLAVLATHDGRPVLALVPAESVGTELQTAFDETLPTGLVRCDGTPVAADCVLDGALAEEVLGRLMTIGALLAAAEALGAANQALQYAARYAGERRQFGVPISSFQALRHLLADMYVRQASGWSAVLYAGAAFDDGLTEATQTASVAKAYVARGAREVAHGAMQVFGGVAFTAEHPAHRFLRRIVVREQQFGDAVHHERRLGRALAGQARRAALAGAAAS